MNKFTTKGDCLLWRLRFVIPMSLCEPILKELHERYPGVSQMKSTMRSYLWWLGVDSGLEELTKLCFSCQAVK